MDQADPTFSQLALNLDASTPRSVQRQQQRLTPIELLDANDVTEQAYGDGASRRQQGNHREVIDMSLDEESEVSLVNMPPDTFN